MIPFSSKVLIGGISLSNPGIGETVRRTRGWMSMISDQSAAVEVVTGAWGMVVVTDLAFAAGAASIPGPVTDASDDGWFVWEAFIGEMGVASNSTPDNAGRVFDSKAMRRVEEGFTVAIMVENAHTVFGMDFGVQISMLTSLS